eukprot:gene27467-33171_t
MVKECATAKFDESIDVAVQLGIDAKKSDQVVRGAVVLPNGTGKTARVAVFAQGAKAEEARAAGADIVGMDDLAAMVKAGDMPFDVVIAAPDAMRVVGTLGQILGPRGLMPNPKVGTVTPDVATAVRNAKAGQVQFRVDKAGIVHGTIGRRSFDTDKLQGNLAALIEALVKAKPATSKGVYLRKVAVSSTMGGLELKFEPLHKEGLDVVGWSICKNAPGHPRPLVHAMLCLINKLTDEMVSLGQRRWRSRCGWMNFQNSWSLQIGVFQGEKEAVITEVTDLAAKAQTLVMAEYRGITVADMTNLRVKARSLGVSLSVLKNTLARRAVAGTQFEVVADQMTGPLIYGFSEDAVAAAKVVAEFAKTNDKLVIRAGAFAGKALDVNGVKQLASIPSKEVLLAQLCGLLMSPMSRTAVVLGALAAKKGEGEAVAA